MDPTPIFRPFSPPIEADNVERANDAIFQRHEDDSGSIYLSSSGSESDFGETTVTTVTASPAPSRRAPPPSSESSPMQPSSIETPKFSMVSPRYEPAVARVDTVENAAALLRPPPALTLPPQSSPVEPAPRFSKKESQLPTADIADQRHSYSGSTSTGSVAPGQASLANTPAATSVARPTTSISGAVPPSSTGSKGSSLRRGFAALRRTLSDASGSVGGAKGRGRPGDGPAAASVSTSNLTSQWLVAKTPRADLHGSSTLTRTSLHRSSDLSAAGSVALGKGRSNTAPSGPPKPLSASTSALPSVSRARAGSVVGAAKKLRSAAKSSSLAVDQGQLSQLSQAQKFFNRASTGIVAAESLPKNVRALTLKNVMAFNSLSKVYADWLGTQQCGENVTFWKKVQEYKGLKGVECMRQALYIYSQFMVPNAPFEINVSNQSIRDTEALLVKLGLIVDKTAATDHAVPEGLGFSADTAAPEQSKQKIDLENVDYAAAARCPGVTDEQKRNLFKRAQKEVWRNLHDAFPQFAQINEAQLGRAVREMRKNLIQNYETACEDLLAAASALVKQDSEDAGKNDEMKAMIQLVEQKLHRLRCESAEEDQNSPDVKEKVDSN